MVHYINTHLGLQFSWNSFTLLIVAVTKFADVNLENDVSVWHLSGMRSDEPL